MLKAGALNKRISLMSFDGGTWTFLHGLWTQATAKERVIYSPYAVGVPGMEFIIRKIDITPAYAFQFAGQHYMLTEPFEEIEGGAGLKISAAAVTLTTCTREAPGYTMGALNRPVASAPVIFEFPGVLAQKYVRWQQQEPNAVAEDGLILTTPKEIALATGDIIKIAGAPYAVRACYTLAAYRNDYEIVKEADT
jgi:hypothetical protein